MKIQIDTIQKTIKLESSENLGELIDLLEKMLPNNIWKEFKIDAGSTIIWNSSPIIWWEYYQPYQPPINPYPYPTPSYPWITCSSGNFTLNQGTYNIEI